MSDKPNEPQDQPAKPGKDDYETVEPPVQFKGVVSGKPAANGKITLDRNAIERAERELEKLSGSFGEWMKDELDTLRAAHQAAQSADFMGEPREKLYRVAHDLRGQGKTLGYPLVGSVAGSLSEMLQSIPEDVTPPEDIVTGHVQSIAAIVREDAKGDDNKMAIELANTLREVSQAWLDARGYPEEPETDAEPEAA